MVFNLQSMLVRSLPIAELSCILARARVLARARARACALVGAMFVIGGCLADTSGVTPTDNAAAEVNCAQGGRADDIVRKTAMSEFTEFGKNCELYEISTFPQNERETVWRVCCGGAALNYIFFPDKCVARRASGLIQCKN